MGFFFTFKLYAADGDMIVNGKLGIGIGTSSPQENLHIQENGVARLRIAGSGDGTDAAEINLYDTTDNKFWMIGRRDKDFSGSNRLIFSFFDGNWHQPLDLLPDGSSVFNGNVGISGNLRVPADNFGINVDDLVRTNCRDSAKINRAKHHISFAVQGVL